MPRVGLLQITKLLKWLTLVAGRVSAPCRGIFFFGFYCLHLTTIHLLAGEWVQLIPFPGLSRSFQKPSTTAVSCVRVFLLDLVTSSSVVLARLSYLPRFASLGPFPRGVVRQQVPDLPPLEGVKTWPFSCTSFEPLCASTGRERTFPSRQQPGKITTGTCDSSSHHFDIAVRTEQRYQHDVVMHELCACIIQIKEAASVL